VFTKAAYFNGQQAQRSGVQAFPGQQQYSGFAGQQAPYGQQVPYGQPYVQPQYQQDYSQGTYQRQPYIQQGSFPSQQPQQRSGYVMTLDDVITKSAITMGLLVLVAAASFWFFNTFYNPALYMGALVVSTIAAFVTVLVVSMRRTVSPAAVLAYSVVEGVLIGAISMVFDSMYPGIVATAVAATFAAAGVTLLAYKGLHIKVTSRFRQMVFVGTGAFALVMMVNFVLSLLNINLGIISLTGPVGWLAALCSLIGVALAVFNLIIDFDYIERGVAAGAPASESWRAAFGLTVTMVWLYIELLRILSYFQRN
jgi:uncharacterized YccA/Bax inhibitor family protein